MTRKFAQIVAVAAVLLFAASLASAESGVPLPDGYRLPMHFPTGGYWPWERMGAAAKRAGFDDPWVYAEKLLRDLKEKYHWNTVWGINFGIPNARKFLEIADRVGIRVVMNTSYYDHAYYHFSHGSLPPIRDAAKKTFEELGKFKMLAGYVLGDEPRTANLGFAEAFRGEMKKLDPGRICLTVTTTRATSGAALRTGLPVIVPDLYFFGHPRNPNLPNKVHASRAAYRYSVKYLSRLTSETRKRPWIMPQMFQSVWGLRYFDENQNVVAEKGASLHWRMPTVGETRWQIWCPLANNIKGVLFYVLFPPHHPRKKGKPQKKGATVPKGLPLISRDFATGASRAMLCPDGTPTPQMSASAEVFAFIRKHDALLDRLEPLKPEIAYAARPAFAHSFRDPQTGDLYMICYSDETDKDSTAEMTFIRSVQSARDVRSDKILSVEETPFGLSRVKVPLRPGDGTMLALKLKAAGEPMSVFNEDFRVTIRAKLENAKRVVLKGQYGQGWRCGIVGEQSDGPSQQAGAITYPLTGRYKYILNRYPKDATVYVVYRGNLARKDQESLILCTSKDGKAFTWTAVGILDFPVKLPRDATALRFLIKPGAFLEGFEVISVPHADAK